MCPCPYPDYTSELRNGDLLKWILWDKQKIIKYTETRKYDFSEFL
jgi:hypothetical protein